MRTTGAYLLCMVSNDSGSERAAFLETTIQHLALFCAFVFPPLEPMVTKLDLVILGLC